MSDVSAELHDTLLYLDGVTVTLRWIPRAERSVAGA